MKYAKKFAALVLIGGLLAGCAAPTSQSEDNQVTATTTKTATIAVETQKPVRGALALDGEFLGTIMPGEVVNVVSPVMGIVESIAVEEGQYVNDGQMLFKLDDDSVQAQLNSARVGYETSQINKEQGMFNANNNLTNAELSHDQLLITQEQSLYNVDNSVINAGNSIKNLELARDQAIKQAEDMLANAQSVYEQTVASQNQTLGASQEITDLQTDKALADLQDKIDQAKEESDKTLQALSDAEYRTLIAWNDIKDSIGDISGRISSSERKISAVENALSVQASHGGQSFAELVGLAQAGSIEGADAILSANSTLQAVGMSAGQVSAGTVAGLESELGMLESQYQQAVASESAAESAYYSAYDAYSAARDSSDTGIDTLEKELEHQEELAEIKNGQLREEAQQLLDEQLEKALLSIEQAEKSLELTKQSYEVQLEQAKEAQQTAETAGGFTESTLEGQINQSSTAVEASKDSLGILESVYDAQIQSAQLNIDAVQLQLDQYTVESPINGIIENITLVEDSMVSNSSVVATISDYSTMEVVFYVGETVKNEIKLGQTVDFELEGKYYEGKINEISNSVDQASRLFKVTALVDPEEEKFSNGVTVRLTTGTFEEEQTIIVPYDSVIFSNGMSYVFKVVDGKAVRQEVEVGLFTEDSISILSGLTEEDEIITTWSEGLRDGVEVAIISDTVEEEPIEQEKATEDSGEAVDAAEVDNENN